MLSRRATVLLASLLLLAAAATLRADDLYFADTLNFFDPDGNSIRAVSTDGTGLRTVIRTGAGIRALDLDAHRIYWTDADNGTVFRANRNGHAVKAIDTGRFPSALRLSATQDFVYWGDQGEALHRVNTNGRRAQTLASTDLYRGLALDEARGRIYWTVSDTATSGRILRANLDGSGLTTVVSSPDPFFKPGSIALDIAGAKVYWTDSVVSKVRRANLDGTGIEDLFDSSALGAPRGITLDLASGKVYWGQDIESEGFLFGEIRRMNLDGSDPETVASGLGSVNDLVLVSGSARPEGGPGEEPATDALGNPRPASDKLP